MDRSNIIDVCRSRRSFSPSLDPRTRWGTTTRLRSQSSLGEAGLPEAASGLERFRFFCCLDGAGLEGVDFELKKAIIGYLVGNDPRNFARPEPVSHKEASGL